MQRWEHVWRHLFHRSKGLFRDKADNKSDGFEKHHGAFQASDDIWALQNSVVHFFSFHHIDWALFSLLIWSPSSQQRSRRGLNRGHQYSGSASHTVPGKIISASSPHRFKSVHLRLWIRNWLQTKRLINTAEIQNCPQRRLTHQPVLCTTQQRCVSAGPLSPQCISHDIKPGHGITRIIQVDFSDVESSAVLSSSLICCSGGSEAVVAFSGYLLRLFHSESCRTLAALLEQRDSGVGRWEADIWHAMRLVLCSQASFWRPTALAAVEN